MDALDRACAHWQEQKKAVVMPTSQLHPPQGGWRDGLARWFVRLGHKLAPLPTASGPDLLEVMKSDRQGIELTRLKRVHNADSNQRPIQYKAKTLLSYPAPCYD